LQKFASAAVRPETKALRDAEYPNVLKELHRKILTAELLKDAKDEAERLRAESNRLHRVD